MKKKIESLTKVVEGIYYFGILGNIIIGTIGIKIFQPQNLLIVWGYCILLSVSYVILKSSSFLGILEKTIPSLEDDGMKWLIPIQIIVVPIVFIFSFVISKNQVEMKEIFLSPFIYVIAISPTLLMIFREFFSRFIRIDKTLKSLTDKSNSSIDKSSENNN